MQHNYSGVAIAIFSVQNATSVSLKFLTFQLVQIPAGLVLTIQGVR
ncbi:MAG: hypothetical protein V7L23_33890 [Nostoc sp.]